MSGPFDTSLNAVEAALAATPRDVEALVQGFYAVRRDFPADPAVEDVRRCFAVCNAAMEIDPVDARLRRLLFAVMETVKRMIVDPAGWHRAHVQRSFDHHTAFGREMPGARFDEPIPVAHLPITAQEARTLIQPLLSVYEAGLSAAPMRHFNLAWDVLMHPVAPFDRVFSDWLKELEARGLGFGDSHSALRRAMAFCSLADRGQQRVSRKAVDKIFLPVLDDANAMLAAAAARFLGRIHADPEDVEEFYNHGMPWGLPDLLVHIAERPAAVRRAVAGGFLNGFADCDDPFELLRADERMEGFDLDTWVFAILNNTPEETLIPSAQAFWFYVHEGFANSPDFVMRLIDHGHYWEAMMCATEIQDAVEGMEPVLQRLVAEGDETLGRAAARHLEAHYATGAQ